MKKKDIVLIDVPFTDLSQRKLRPALVLAKIQEDLLCCFISSRAESQTDSDVFVKKDVMNNLKVNSVIKPFKLFTLHISLVEWKIGMLNDCDYDSVATKIKRLID